MKHPIEPQKYLGQFVYKYGSCQHLEWLKPVILESRLYFPTPRELNDPAEARPPLTAASMQALIERLIQLTIERQPFLTSEGILREARTIRFNARRFSTKILLDRMAQSLYPHLETFHIYSLSKRLNNEHLWMRYAGKHTGYCLEFSNEDFLRVFEVRYSDVELDITEPAQFQPFFLFYKTKAWGKEEEVRIIGRRDAGSTIVLEPHLLTRLILGREITSENAATIRAWACERNPPLTVVDERECAPTSMVTAGGTEKR